MASRLPVDAPEGTAARPMVPDSSKTSHSTVGLPRESRISRPTISTIALINVFQNKKSKIKNQKSTKSQTPSAITMRMMAAPWRAALDHFLYSS
jgi:hypothetical protein